MAEWWSRHHVSQWSSCPWRRAQRAQRDSISRDTLFKDRYLLSMSLRLCHNRPHPAKMIVVLRPQVPKRNVRTSHFRKKGAKLGRFGPRRDTRHLDSRLLLFITHATASKTNSSAGKLTLFLRPCSVGLTCFANRRRAQYNQFPISFLFSSSEQ